MNVFKNATVASTNTLSLKNANAENQFALAAIFTLCPKQKKTTEISNVPQLNTLDNIHYINWENYEFVGAK